MSSSVIRHYRPRNGAEAEKFAERFCARCARRLRVSAGGTAPGCAILARAFCDDIESIHYPAELRLDRKGQPMCRLYTPLRRELWKTFFRRILA